MFTCSSCWFYVYKSNYFGLFMRWKFSHAVFFFLEVSECSFSIQRLPIILFIKAEFLFLLRKFHKSMCNGGPSKTCFETLHCILPSVPTSSHYFCPLSSHFDIYSSVSITVCQSVMRCISVNRVKKHVNSDTHDRHFQPQYSVNYINNFLGL